MPGRTPASFRTMPGRSISAALVCLRPWTVSSGNPAAGRSAAEALRDHVWRPRGALRPSEDQVPSLPTRSDAQASVILRPPMSASTSSGDAERRVAPPPALVSGASKVTPSRGRYCNVRSTRSWPFARCTPSPGKRLTGAGARRDDDEHEPPQVRVLDAVDQRGDLVGGRAPGVSRVGSRPTARSGVALLILT